MLNEYAIRVFSLIDQAVKLEAVKRLEEIDITALPYLEESDRTALISRFKTMALEKTEIVDDEYSKSDINKLKNILNG